MDNAKLLARCRAGDEVAVEQLVREFQPRLFRLALSILEDGSGLGGVDAEEVTQDAFVRAFRSLESFRGDASLSTWLYSITVNLCRNVLRSRKRRDRIRRIYQAFIDLGEHASHSTEQSYLVKESQDNVMQAVNALNDKQRLVVILRYYHECSVSEIAQIIDVPEGTVHSRLNTARSQLKTFLERQLSEEKR